MGFQNPQRNLTLIVERDAPCCKLAEKPSNALSVSSLRATLLALNWNQIVRGWYDVKSTPEEARQMARATLLVGKLSLSRLVGPIARWTKQAPALIRRSEPVVSMYRMVQSVYRRMNPGDHFGRVRLAG